MTARPRSWRRLGCFAVGGLALLLVLFGGGAWLLARSQNRSEAPEAESRSHDVAAGVTRGSVELEVEIAQLIVWPAPAGAPLRLDAVYDPERFVLEESWSEDADGGWAFRLSFAARGSRAWALFRVKAGAQPPTVRLELPRDVRLTVDGRLVNGFGALEFGGLDLAESDIHVEGGGASVSFREPTLRPMDRFELSGDKGSVEVTGLGMGSPASVRLFQHLGEIDVDLRGPWSRDAEIRITGALAGGQVWLPQGVDLRRGGEFVRRPSAPGDAEIPRPAIDLDLNEHAGRLIVIDPERP